MSLGCPPCPGLFSALQFLLLTASCMGLNSASGLFLFLSPSAPHLLRVPRARVAIPTTGWLTTTEIHSLAALDARGLKSRCRQGWLLREVLRVNLFYAPRLVSGGCQKCTAPSLRSLPPISTLRSPLLRWTPVARFSAYPVNPRRFRLEIVNYICKDPCPDRVTFTVAKG